jgi:hypothetical protein
MTRIYTRQPGPAESAIFPVETLLQAFSKTTHPLFDPAGGKKHYGRRAPESPKETSAC